MTTIYSTMPSKDGEKDWILGLLLFGSDFSLTYWDLYQSRDKFRWKNLNSEEKFLLIQANMPIPEDGSWQNVPHQIDAPNLMTDKIDALGRDWRAYEYYESHSRNTVLIKYRGVSSDVYGYTYIELIASEQSSMHNSAICQEWADGEATAEKIITSL